MVEATLDPALRSWVETANDPLSDFPIQNLPLGRFRDAPGGPWRIGVAIGDDVLDLWATGLVQQDMTAVLAAAPSERRALRTALCAGLRQGSALEARWRAALRPRAAVELGLPCDIRGYTDFYTGIHHAKAVGRLFRPDNPLLPNYKWVPIGYHGRSSSICASGHTFHRPRGQVKPPEADAPPVLAATERLDYELELGIIVGRGNERGVPIPIAQAEERIYGVTLLNDWSARDVQAWEYQPLGPFLAKNFATTLSPWIVTLEALSPFREPFRRPAGDPEPLAYLDSPATRESGAIAIELEVRLETERMRRSGESPVRLSTSNYRDAYWTLGQLMAHHTVNGCNLETGDVLGTGTLSGPEPGQGGSMLELSVGGRQPIRLPNGESRTFLADGDTIILTAGCRREGFRRIGFGECRATVAPARPLG